MSDNLFDGVEFVDIEIDENRPEEIDEDHKIAEDEYEQNEREEKDEDKVGKDFERKYDEDYEDQGKIGKGVSYISQAPEWRTFSEDAKSFNAVRTGQALKGNRMLETKISENPKLQKIQDMLSKLSRTDEEQFNNLLLFYSINLNISKKTTESLIEHIVPFIKRIKYKNALTTLLAYLCIKNGEIDKKRIPIVIEEATRNTKYKIRIPDVYRYCFMIIDILKNKRS